MKSRGDEDEDEDELALLTKNFHKCLASTKSRVPSSKATKGKNSFKPLNFLIRKVFNLASTKIMAIFNPNA